MDTELLVVREEYGRLYPELPVDPLRRAAQRYLDAQHDRAILAERLDADGLDHDLDDQYAAVLDRVSNAEIALRVVLAGALR